MKAMVSLYDSIAKCDVVFDFYSAVIYLKGEYSEVHVGGRVLIVDTHGLASVAEAADIKVAHMLPQQPQVEAGEETAEERGETVEGEENAE